jgi:hypothetical protein
VQLRIWNEWEGVRSQQWEGVRSQQADREFKFHETELNKIKYLAS